MTGTEYAEWAKDYAARVGLNYPAGQEMLLAFWPDVDRAGIDQGTLRAAGDRAADQLGRQAVPHQSAHRAVLFAAIDAVVGERRREDDRRAFGARRNGHQPYDRAAMRRRLEALFPGMKWSTPPPADVSTNP